MARKMKKFSAGGAQGKYDRRMADIEKDFKKDSAGKTGKALEVLEAKAAQRKADAEDDRAKRTGADRTATRAAERAAESNLTKTRKYGAPKAVTTEAPAAKVTDSLGAITAPKSGLSTPASKPVVKKVNKPVQQPKPSAADIARQKAKIGASNAPSDQGFSSKSKVLGATATAAKSKSPVNAGRSPGYFAGLFSGTNKSFEESQARKYGYAKAKGGKIMKYAKGGATPPKPSDADRARSKKHLDELKKLKPTAEEGKVAGSANRSEGPGYKKGGKAKGKSFAATKFGAAMMKKSADTKGRAMPKFAKGGSIDGCAVKGKTKTSMVKMKNGGSC